MKKVIVLGSTGSIGKTTLNVIKNNEGFLRAYALVCNGNLGELHKQIAEFKPEIAVSLKHKLLITADGKERAIPDNFIVKPDFYAEGDIAVNGISGLAGLKPALACLEAGKVLAIANKESFVSAGKLIKRTAQRFDAKIRPLDSEHSAVWQCVGAAYTDIESITLTASGGAFRDFTREQLKNVTASEALIHPTWKMGQKVTVDCATLMNKGMEVIEAKHLFDVEKVDAVLHPQSIVHALIQMRDNSVISCLSYPNMEIPVSYAINFPRRAATTVPKLNLAAVQNLTFGDIDESRFPCFTIAKEVAAMTEKRDFAGAVMSAADEICVELFLQGQIGFYDISSLISRALDRFTLGAVEFTDAEEVLSIERAVKEYTLGMVRK